MKIAISSTRDKTRVHDKSGEIIFQTDSSVELTQYLEGVKKEFPEAEFLFLNNPIQPEILEAGKLDGKRLKQEN